MKILIVDRIDYENKECLQLLSDFMKRGNIVFGIKDDITGSRDEKMHISLAPTQGSNILLYGCPFSKTISRIEKSNTGWITPICTGYAKNPFYVDEGIPVFLNYLLEEGKEVCLDDIITISFDENVILSSKRLGIKTIEVPIYPEDYFVNVVTKRRAFKTTKDKEIGNIIVGLRDWFNLPPTNTNRLANKLPISDSMQIKCSNPKVLFSDLHETLLFDKNNKKTEESKETIEAYLKNNNLLAIVTSVHGGFPDTLYNTNRFFNHIEERYYENIFIMQAGMPCFVFGTYFKEENICEIYDGEKKILLNQNVPNIPISFGGDKSVVVKRFLDFLQKNGCNPQGLYAIGDDFPDLRMLQVVNNLGGQAGLICSSMLETRNPEEREILEAFKPDMYPSVTEFAKVNKLIR